MKNNQNEANVKPVADMGGETLQVRENGSTTQENKALPAQDGGSATPESDASAARNAGSPTWEDKAQPAQENASPTHKGKAIAEKENGRTTPDSNPSLAQENAKHTPEVMALAPREYALLLPALALGALVGFGFDSVHFIPCLGAILFGCLFTAAALFAARRRLRWTIGNALLLACALLLFLCYGLWANEPLRVLNAPVAAGSLMLALFHLCGAQAGPLGRMRVIGRSFSLSLRGAFWHMGLPFRGARGAARGSAGGLKAIGLGLLIALPLAILAGMLLASADQVFSGLFANIALGFSGEELARNLWSAAESLLIGLMAFSLLYALRKGRAAEEKPRRAPALAPLSLAVVLSILNLLYLVFAYIQFAYLFGGAGHAAMQGGWAHYARSGFFELVAVSLINLGLVMLCVTQEGRHRPLTILCGLLLALTALILASAARRMGLYIQAFGPSLLRLLTLWGMAMIACAIIAAAIRLARPGFRPFPLLLALSLSSWLLLNLSGPAGRVADWQARAYLSGRLNKMDYAYLVRLGPDALPALQRLEQAGAQEATGAIRSLKLREAAPWYAWSWSEHRLRRQ